MVSQSCVHSRLVKLWQNAEGLHNSIDFRQLFACLIIPRIDSYVLKTGLFSTDSNTWLEKGLLVVLCIIFGNVDWLLVIKFVNVGDAFESLGFDDAIKVVLLLTSSLESSAWFGYHLH